MLVEKGAGVEARNGRGETALDLATREGRGEVVEALVRRGAGINGGCRDPQVCDTFFFMWIAKVAAKAGEALQRQTKSGRSQAKPRQRQEKAKRSDLRSDWDPAIGDSRNTPLTSLIEPRRRKLHPPPRRCRRRLPRYRQVPPKRRCFTP